jgi:hypothetical protein
VVTSPRARFPTLHTPGGGFDEFVAEMGNIPLAAGEALAGGAGPDPEELTRIAASHGIQIVGPPLLP